MIEIVDEIYERELRPGERITIAVAETVGSWRFIIGQSLFFAAWIVLNGGRGDPTGATDPRASRTPPRPAPGAGARA